MSLPSFSQLILTAIAHDHTSADAKDVLEPLGARPQRAATVSGQKNVTKRPYLRAIGMLVAALCVLVLVVALLPQLTQTTIFNNSPTTQMNAAAPNFWVVDEKQTVVRNGSDIFAIKTIEGTAQGFRLYYAFRSAQAAEVPHIEVISLLPSHPGSTIHVATTSNHSEN
ncbi:hypothetical protein KDW_57880 [Dictyobacter vulcani]|uniref:Uncharacterized protein n=1 Tax=Dictyobacter vulcani TaxID=2607529 RepID=A0A5J4L2E2_9CHLR|nr:hypothetical protein [Dictyobacter vulcani]GER91626.1 hypothetical protein KDW_57880 [Dictyobacter vulcani]